MIDLFIEVVTVSWGQYFGYAADVLLKVLV